MFNVISTLFVIMIFLALLDMHQGLRKDNAFVQEVSSYRITDSTRIDQIRMMGVANGMNYMDFGGESKGARSPPD